MKENPRKNIRKKICERIFGRKSAKQLSITTLIAFSELLSNSFVRKKPRQQSTLIALSIFFRRIFSLKNSSWIYFEYFFADFLSNILSRIFLKKCLTYVFSRKFSRFLNMFNILYGFSFEKVYLFVYFIIARLIVACLKKTEDFLTENLNQNPRKLPAENLWNNSWFKVFSLKSCLFSE